MTIGLTYDLCEYYIQQGYSAEEAAEFDSPETIDGIEQALIALGYKTERIGTIKELIPQLAIGNRWDLVFNIAEGVNGIGREAQIPALLDAYNIPYTFSDPMVLSLTLHKGMTKHVINNLGIPTAVFTTIKSINELEEYKFTYPLFIKPACEGTGKGIYDSSYINNQKELYERCDILFRKFKQDILIEKYLSGREFTVGILGTGRDAKIIAVMEIVSKADSTIYSLHQKKNYKEKVYYTLPTADIAKKCERIALDAWTGLGCRDCGRIDIRCDDMDNPYFLEVNPLAGLHPIDSDLPIMCSMVGISYNELIKDIVEAAFKHDTFAHDINQYHQFLAV